MADNKNLPAYPNLGYETSDNGAPGHFTTKSGISQRTLIAAMCLQGMLSDIGKYVTVGFEQPGKLPEIAVNYADALLTHLENTSK